jgi:hypothetical protein
MSFLRLVLGWKMYGNASVRSVPSFDISLFHFEIAGIIVVISFFGGSLKQNVTDLRNVTVVAPQYNHY